MTTKQLLPPIGTMLVFAWHEPCPRVNQPVWWASWDVAVTVLIDEKHELLAYHETIAPRLFHLADRVVRDKVAWIDYWSELVRTIDRDVKITVVPP